MAEPTRRAVTWAGSHIVERVVRAFAEDMHRRGLLPELSEKSCSRTTAALAKALGDPNLSVLEQMLTAAEEAPPLSLPAVLTSVDDVARVCEAAALAERAGGGRVWMSADGRVVVRSNSITFDNVLQVQVADSDGNSWRCTGTRVPLGPLWSAIQAARSGEPS